MKFYSITFGKKLDQYTCLSGMKTLKMKLIIYVFTIYIKTKKNDTEYFYERIYRFQKIDKELFMPKGQKYKKLTEHLKECKLNTVKVSFDELERIMKEKIPNSIYTYKTFGSNFDHSFSYGWSLAGYSAKADFNNNTVVFTKEKENMTNSNLHKKLAAKSKPTSDMKVLDFFERLQIDRNDRYKSWEHCYNFFTKNRNKDISLSEFSLHLFAYLASWGMFRGSSFLLQKDYLFHNEVVEEILQSKYDCLVGINPKELDYRKISLIFDLSNTISQLYYKNTYYIKGVPNSNTYPSNTLITKILLGTLGCVPAYDRYFIEGMKLTGLNNRSFDNKSITILKDYYLENHSVFDKNQSIINQSSETEYPMMKLLDMHFWQLGYEYDVLNK